MGACKFYITYTRMLLVFIVLFCSQNPLRLASCFISLDKISQNFGLKNAILFVPLQTLYTQGIQEPDYFPNQFHTTGLLLFPP